MTDVPASFPHPIKLGAIAGAQPKLLVQKVGDKYVSGVTEEDLKERYAICSDMVEQLHAYSERKLLENPTQSKSTLVESIKVSVKNKGWGFSDAEIDWIGKELASKLSIPAS